MIFNNKFAKKQVCMKIENIFAEIQSYEKLCSLTEKAEPKISFWGSRYIVIEGYEGYLDLHSITQCLFQLIEKNYEFNEKERAYGKRIAARIDYIYNKSTEILKTCCCITRVFVFLRNLSIIITPSLTTYWKQYDGRSSFEFYTRQQFYKVFGYQPEDAEKRGIKLGEWIHDIHRWCILQN